MIQASYLSCVYSADNKRCEFDMKNKMLLQNKVPVDYVFLGDSITEIWELTAYFPEKVIINRGIGGDVTEGVLHRFEADFLQLQPKCGILMIGINDASGIDFDIWRQIEGVPVTDVLEKAVKNLEAMAKLAKERKIPLAMCSVMPTDMKHNSHESQRKQYVLDLNEAIQKICNKYDAIYVDYHSALVAEDGRSLREDCSFDDLHLEVKGYDIASEVLKTTMKFHGFDL